MRILLIVILGYSSYAFSKSVTKRNIDDLASRLEQLEARVSLLEQKSGVPTSLKVKDLNNNTIESAQDRSTASVNDEGSMTEIQKKEVMEQIEILKKNQAEKEQILNQLMNEEN